MRADMTGLQSQPEAGCKGMGWDGHTNDAFADATDNTCNL